MSSSESGTILITGGFGKTSSQVSQVLQSRGRSILIGSRKGQSGVPSPFKAVKFDWLDKSTWITPFVEDTKITSVYLVPGPGLEPYGVMQEFIEFIRDNVKENAPKRFVVLSALQYPSPRLGESYHKLRDWLASSGLEWTTLKPTWFMGRFSLQSFCAVLTVCSDRELRRGVLVPHS
jgi:festuclavine dehydrogenase